MSSHAKFGFARWAAGLEVWHMYCYDTRDVETRWETHCVKSRPPPPLRATARREVAHHVVGGLGTVE